MDVSQKTTQDPLGAVPVITPGYSYAAVSYTHLTLPTRDLV